jgi:DNA-directed RNA polymerase subunit RPC12/RpoP
MGGEEPAGRLRDGTPYYGELGRMRRDGDGQRVQCHLYGDWFRIVGGAHLRLAHGGTIEEYREAFELFKGAATCSAEESGRRRKRTSERVASGEFGTIATRPQAMARAHLAARWPPAISRWRSLAVKYPELLAEWHPTRNDGVDPHTVGAGSERGVWWRCGRCEHEWRTSPKERKRGTGCPACARRLAGQRKAHVPRERSLAVRAPALLADWHPTRNEGLDPYSVGVGSDRVVWWRCHRCGHEWQARPNQRRAGQRCPACRASPDALCA